MNSEPAHRFWTAGEPVVLRYITRDDRPGMSWPCTVVSDTAELVALYIPRGITYKAWSSSPERGRHLADARWRKDVLRLMYPGRGYSIWVQWDDSDDRRFTGYYVNFEEPFRRGPIGFDTNDHTLDITVTREFVWAWKDRAEFETRAASGIYSAAFAARVREEAEEVVAGIGPGFSPFADGWDKWAPDPAWTPPSLPPAWSEVPVAPWDLRRWAYSSMR